MVDDFQVLFVDNSRITRATMAKVIQSQGYKVDTVGTGTEAIEKLESGKFHLVIMDFYMPLMNGYEVAKSIRKLTSNINNIPIIALTASNDPSDREISIEAGINDFIVKSSDHKELLTTIKKYTV